MKKPQEITAREIESALEKVTSEVQEIRYLNGRLIDKIEQMATTACTGQMVMLMLQGKTPDEAGLLAAESLLPLTFHLGLLVGQEMEASDAFTKMMGGLNGPSSDAGDTEHRDQ